MIELSKSECNEETINTWHHDTLIPALMKLDGTSFFSYTPSMKLVSKKPFVHFKTFSQILQQQDIINIIKEFHCTSKDDRSLETFLKDSKENIHAAWPKGGVPHEVIKQFHLTAEHIDKLDFEKCAKQIKKMEDNNNKNEKMGCNETPDQK